MTSSPAIAPDLLLDTVPDDGRAPLGEPDVAVPRRMTYQMQSPVLICTECGRMVPDDGGTCKHCARSRTTMLQNAPVLFTAVFVVAFLAKMFVLFLS